MKKKYLHISFIISITLILICLNSWNSKGDSNPILLQETSEISKDSISAVEDIKEVKDYSFIEDNDTNAAIGNNSKTKEEKEVGKKNSVQKNSTDTMDYNSYLKKIWIVEDWEEADYPLSLIIEKIDNGYIEGRLETGALIKPIYKGLWNKKEGSFSGMITNGVADCNFANQDDENGKLKIIFNERNKITADLTYLNHRSSEYIDNTKLDKNYILRAYNLTDLDTDDKSSIFIKDENLSFLTELDSWKKINITAGIQVSNKSYPIVFLTNEQNDILFSFDANYQIGSELLEVSVGDLNGDNLKDVQIITYFSYVPEAYRFTWNFYQKENGLFYKDENEIKKMLEEQGD